MKYFKVTTIDGKALETMMPIRSFSIKESFTWFYSSDDCQGYTVAVVANSQIKHIVLGEDQNE